MADIFPKACWTERKIPITYLTRGTISKVYLPSKIHLSHPDTLSKIGSKEEIAAKPPLLNPTTHFPLPSNQAKRQRRRNSPQRNRHQPAARLRDVPLQRPRPRRPGGHGVPQVVERAVGALVQGRGAVEDEAGRVRVRVGGVRGRGLAREAHAAGRRGRRGHEEGLVRPRGDAPARLRVGVAEERVVGACGDCGGGAGLVCR